MKNRISKIQMRHLRVSDNSVEQNTTTSEKKIPQKKPRRNKITSKICKNDGPPKTPSPWTPELVTPQRKNGGKRKSAKNFTNETVHSNDSALGNTNTRNVDGKSSVRRKLNLNEEGQFSSKNPAIYSSASTSFCFFQKFYQRRRIDNIKFQNLTHFVKKIEEKQCLLMPLPRRKMLKKQLKSHHQRKKAMNGISDGLFMPAEIDLNRTSSADCSKNSASYSSASTYFPSFANFYKRRRIERETSFLTMFTHQKIFTFGTAHRLITPAVLETLSGMLETSQVELTNERFERLVHACDLNHLESNDVCSQLMATRSTSVKTTQKPGRHRTSLADVHSSLKDQELALVPYVHPLHSLEQVPDNNVNKNNISNRKNARVPYGEVGAMVPYKRQPNPYRPIVAFDPRNKWLWNCFASKEQIPGSGAFDDDTKRWWENERRVFHGRAESFLAKIHLIQGNRRFSKWKGSVVDSVVGVFLTQNVSDLLSSSSFINLIARFPPKSKENVNGSDSLKTTSSVERSILTMDEKSKFDEAPDDTKEGESSLQNSVGTAFISMDDPIGNSHPVGPIMESNSNDLINNGSDRSSSMIDIQIFKTKEDENQENVLSNCNTSSAAVSSVSPCKNCSQSSICSEIEDLLGNYSCHRLPREEPIVVDAQPGKTVYEKKEPESCGSISHNLEVLKVSESHSKGRVRNKSNKNSKITPRAKKLKTSNIIDWDILRKEACGSLPAKEKSIDHIDSADWEAVSQADVDAIADAIRLRGQHNVLAARVKNFLNRVAKDHGSIDLEWLRNVPPDKAKEYLHSIAGLGLKSVDCVRLLGLHFKAFPVDTNIARIFVRLGWIPLQPLPESAQLHAIDKYPIMGTVQEYLWPRFWTLDQPTLYELHYQLITFGKVFCTKKNPNCNACPMRDECKHFASACASAKRLLTRPEEKSLVNSVYSSLSSIDPFTGSSPLAIAQQENDQLSEKFTVISCEPVIEEPPSPQHEPEPKHNEQFGINYSAECLCNSDEDVILELNLKDASQDFDHINEPNINTEPQDDGNSNLALTVAPFVSFLMPALKSANKFRTKHYVYELPSNHPLLEGMDELEENDEYRYLFAIWKPGENAESSEPPVNHCNFQGFDELCDNIACFRCNSIREAKSEIVRGTLLIPCRTAMRGRFPLNGTYFQVFADNKSSKNPIVVPRNWLWNLRRKICYFGTGISTIFRDLTMEEIRFCMGQGTVCTRGFDRETRRVELLYKRLHVPASQVAKKNSRKGRQQIGKTDDEK